MTIKISRSTETPTQDQILSLEEVLGVKLPSEYIEFLAQNNGGKPETNTFKISENNDSGINGFIPLDKIVYETKLIRDQIGGELMPVAYAEGGNYLCIAVAGKWIGSIFFMDHEIPGGDAITKLAPSLTQFLEDAQPVDPKQVQLKPGQVKKAWINPDFLKK
jgi:hypothetical protein